MGNDSDTVWLWMICYMTCGLDYCNPRTPTPTTSLRNKILMYTDLKRTLLHILEYFTSFTNIIFVIVVEFLFLSVYSRNNYFRMCNAYYGITGLVSWMISQYIKFIYRGIYYWITLCFRRRCFCCSQIWRTTHRQILIFTRSNLINSITHLSRPETILWTNKYRGKSRGRGSSFRHHFLAVSAVWQFVNGRRHLFQLNESTV